MTPVGAPHDPVMLTRVVEALAVPASGSKAKAHHVRAGSVGGKIPEIGPAGVIVDATLGAGGHAAALLSASSPDTHLVGFDRDRAALELGRQRLAEYRGRVHLVHAPFDHFKEHVEPVIRAVGPLRAVLWDLGVSSMQLDRPERGFSFRSDGPLDMRMDPTTGPSAAELINDATPEDLTRWLGEYGEERHARRLVDAIIANRPFHRTLPLADLIAEAMPGKQRRADRAKGVHPATRTFQAIRIAVNGELDRFSASLPQALELLAHPGDGCDRGGRLGVLAYHSLEDRIAKRFLDDAATSCICPPDLPVCGCGRVPILTPVGRKVAKPSSEEIAANPRARSARFRVAERLNTDDKRA